MARHADAIGYLLELRASVGSDWFARVCDLAIASTGAPITPTEMDRLHRLFVHQDKYTPASTAGQQTSQPQPAATATPQPNWLVEMAGFTNFKRLADSLTLTMSKRITLIFGTNGAGKSSLCEAVKILASPQPPESPLRNVINPNPSPPGFSFRFRGDATPRRWQEGQGYGAFAHTFKYFDSTIALRHITDPPMPEAVVEMTPFRLEVFNYCGDIVRQFQADLDAKQARLVAEIQAGIVGLQPVFATVDPIDFCLLKVTGKPSKTAKAGLSGLLAVALAMQGSIKANGSLPD